MLSYKKRSLSIFMLRYFKQAEPTRIPVPGNKIIEEYFGNIATETDDFSLAHMIAPSGWSEPAQVPDFDEITIMIRGKMQIKIEEEENIILQAGETFLSKKGIKVRYSNPFEEQGEYWSICIPAFNIERASRDT